MFCTLYYYLSLIVVIFFDRYYREGIMHTLPPIYKTILQVLLTSIFSSKDYKVQGIMLIFSVLYTESLLYAIHLVIQL